MFSLLLHFVLDLYLVMARIAVIGCGVIGLTTAIAVQNTLGSAIKITIFTEKTTPNTTTDLAAGIWSPQFLAKTDNNKICKWAKSTQNYVLRLWKEGRANEAGICLQNVLMLSDEEDFELPLWLEHSLGYMDFSKKQLDYYSKLYGKKFTGGYSYTSFSWEGSKLLAFLQQAFLENGGAIQIRKITNFDELSDFDVIVNCTGLNARELINDLSVRPMRGQIIKVSAPWQFHTLGIPTKNLSYIVPNINYVVLGGTQELDNYNMNVDEKDKEQIMTRCYHYIPSLKNAPILKHSVGLRPIREQVRLETEMKKIGTKNIKIVHNYGHGGSGITISIGCAKEAAQLVKDALMWNNRSKL